MARPAGDVEARLATVATLGGVGILAALGLGEWLLGDYWLGVAVAAMWAGATVLVGRAQGTRGRARAGRAVAGTPRAQPRRRPLRRPRTHPPPGPRADVVAGPVHVDGAWVRVVRTDGRLAVECWTGHAWRAAADDPAVLAAAMPLHGRPPD